MGPESSRGNRRMRKQWQVKVLQRGNKKKIRMLIKDKVGVGTRTVKRPEFKRLRKKSLEILSKITSGAAYE